MPRPRALGIGNAWLLLLLSLVAGCTGGHAIGPDELADAREGKAATVLIHFVPMNQDGEPLKPFDGVVPNLILSIGDFETGGAPTKEIVPGYPKPLIGVRYLGRFYSEQFRNEGWLALILPPGYYYLCLGAVYSTWALAVDRGRMCLPGSPEWSIEVPAGVPTIYAGTFNFTVRTTWDIGGPNWATINQLTTHISDEADLAKDVSRRDVASLPLPVTRLAARLAGPHLLGVPTAASN